MSRARNKRHSKHFSFRFEFLLLTNASVAKPCLYFQTGHCPLSATECDFAHVLVTDDEELDRLKNPQATLRTKPCKFFLSGRCKDGDWCRFKHPISMEAVSNEMPLVVDDGLRAGDPDSDSSVERTLDVREVEGAKKLRPEEHPKYRSESSMSNHCTCADYIPSS